MPLDDPDVPAAPRWVSVGFGLVPLGLYVWTAAPGPGWIDAPLVAHYASEPVTGIWVNHHNLFNLVGHVWIALWSGSDPHRALNLLSALLGAVTVHLCFLTVCTITRRLGPALFAAVALMVSHSLWWHSTMLEVYTLNTALMMAALWLVARHVDRGRGAPLLGAALCMGLGCANHVLMGLLLAGPLAMLLVPSTRAVLLRPRFVLGLALAFVAGFSPYLIVFAREFLIRSDAAGAGGDAWKVLATMIDQTTGGHFKRRMFTPLHGSGWIWRLNYLFLLVVNFPSAALACGLVGLVSFGRRQRWRGLFAFFVASLGAQVLWSANYVIWDMYAFALPAFVLFGVAVGIGADAVSRRLRSRSMTLRRSVVAVAAASLLVGPWLYARVPQWAGSDGFWQRYFARFRFVSNLWDPVEYFANPDKRGYVRAHQVSRAVLSLLPRGAHLLDDDGKGHYPIGLYYQQTLGQRPDVRFHALFGPEVDDEVATEHALALKTALDRSEPVYVSSPYWPERRVLDRLFTMLAPDRRRRSLEHVRELDVDALEAEFPRVALRRVSVLPDDPAFIYELVPAPPIVAEGEVQAEVMPVLELTTGAKTSTRYLGPAFGGHFDRAWEPAQGGGRIVLGFRTDRPQRARLRLRVVQSSGIDAVRIVVVDGHEKQIDVTELPARAIDLGTLQLEAGSHRLSLEVDPLGHPSSRMLAIDALELIDEDTR